MDAKEDALDALSASGAANEAAFRALDSVMHGLGELGWGVLREDEKALLRRKVFGRREELGFDGTEAAHSSAQAIANDSLIGLWLLVSNLIMAVAWGRVFYQASVLQVCICVYVCARVGTTTLTYTCTPHICAHYMHVLPLLPHEPPAHTLTHTCTCTHTHTHTHTHMHTGVGGGSSKQRADCPVGELHRSAQCSGGHHPIQGAFAHIHAHMHTLIHAYMHTCTHS
jgi:hypothetical protein